MGQHFGQYPHHADPIHCSHCGQEGRMVWEDVPEAGGHGKELVRIEGDFYERIRTKAPHPIELVCHGCGAIQSAQPS